MHRLLKGVESLMQKVTNNARHIFDEKVLAKKLLKLEFAEWLLLLMIISHSIVFSYFHILKHYSFRTGAWDLGILTQSIASASKGKLFINNVELYYSSTGSYFGVHFSPILFTLIPIFSLAPSVEIILIAQSAILALGGLPAYLLGMHCLKDRRASLAFSAAYLLNPSLQGFSWYDLTPESFFPLFILSATYFLKKRRTPHFLFFTLLSLMTLEQAAYFVVFYLFYVLWELKGEVKKVLSPKKSLLSFLPLITFLLIILWIAFSSNVKTAINPNPPEELLAIGNYRILDVSSIMEVPVKALANLDLSLKAINYDLPSKVLYVTLTYAPSCFLAFLSPIALLPSFFWILLSLLSNWPPYYQLGFHYAAFTLPFIFTATLEGVQILFNGTDEAMSRKLFLKASMLVLVVAVILSIFASPFSPLHKPGDFRYFRDYGVTYPSSLNNKVMEIVKIIPKDAFLLTTSTIFAHFSANPNAYVLPTQNFPSETLFKATLKYLKSIRYEYILLSYYWDKTESDLIYDNFIRNTGIYGLFLEAPGLELYKLGYNGTSTKVAIKFSYNELSLGEDSIKVGDASSDSGTVIKIKASSRENRVVWYGPYVTLTPGNYTANFKIKVDDLPDGKIVKLDVWSDRLKWKIAECDVYGKNFSKPFTWQVFSISFTIKERTTVEFRGIEAARNIIICLDYIEVFKS